MNRLNVFHVIQLTGLAICILITFYLLPTGYSALFELQFNSYALLALLAAATNTFLLVRISRQQNKTPDTIAFCMFLIGVIIWALTQFLQQTSITPDAAVFWNSAASLGWITLPSTFFVFASLNTNQSDDLRSIRTSTVLFMTTLLLLFVTLVSEFIVVHSADQARLSAWGYYFPVGPYFSIVVVWLELLVISALLLLARKYHQTTKTHQQQIRLILLAVIIPLFGGTITDGILPIIGVHILPTAIFLTTITAMIITYAIERSSLFSFNPTYVAANILESMDELVFILNDTHEVQYVNKRAKSLLGYDAAELLGQPFQSLVTDYTRLFGANKVTKLTRYDQVLAANKHTIPVLVSISPTPATESGRIGHIVVMTDISRVTEIEEQNQLLEHTRKALLKALTQVKTNQTKIAQEKARDEALLSSLGEGMIATDTHSRIIMINERARSILGLEHTNTYLKPLDSLVPVEDEKGIPIPKKVRPGYAVFRENRKLVNNDYYYKSRIGRRFPVSMTVAPVHIRSELVGMVLLFRDITKEKEVDQAKTEFVSLASHQLRTPLATIKWYLELYRKPHQQAHKRTQYLSEIAAANQRMIGLVNALLNVSRIDMGTFAIQPKLMRIATLVHEVVGELYSSIQLKNIRISESYDEKLPKIAVDPNLLRIVVQNLLANAIRYSNNKGKVSVTVSSIKEKSYTRGAPVQHTALIKIQDNGSGIPRDQQSQLYTKLFRADNARRMDPGGTGLGLYITKSILDHIGGAIWYVSEVGKGTTFYVAISSSTTAQKEGLKLDEHADIL